MIVVIQCAGSKRKNAGYLKTHDGTPIAFVAHPELAPLSTSCIYARPDDASDARGTWRDRLLVYNANPDNNPFGLLPAFELYANDIYRALVKKFGVGKTYILSAGWGLIDAAFLTPAYDITFSSSAAPYVRRRKTQAYNDFSMLPSGENGPIVFFGGRDYVPLFAALTASAKDKIVFYNSIIPPAALGCSLRRFRTTARTNWHYECARAFIAGEIDLA